MRRRDFLMAASALGAITAAPLPVAWAAPSPTRWTAVVEPLAHRVLLVDAWGVTRWEVSGEGAEPGRLRRPSDAVIAGDRVVVVDRHNHRVQVFDAGGAARVVVTTADGLRLHQPYGAALLPDGRVAVTDTGNHRVLVLDPATGAAHTLATDLPLNGPAGIALGPDGALHVALAGDGEIAVLPLDGAPGRTYGGADAARGGLLRPFALSIDETGTVLVRDRSAGALVAYDAAGRPVARHALAR